MRFLLCLLAATIAGIVSLTGCQIYRQEITHADGTTVENMAVQLPFSKVDSGLFEAYTTWAEDGSGEMVTGANVAGADTSEGLNALVQALVPLALQVLQAYIANPAAFAPPVAAAPKPEPTPTPVPANPVSWPVDDLIGYYHWDGREWVFQKRPYAGGGEEIEIETMGVLTP